jgi:hypothetical protein
MVATSASSKPQRSPLATSTHLCVFDSAFEQSSSDAQTLPITAHGKFPDAKLIVMKVCTQESDWSVVVIDSHPTRSFAIRSRWRSTV